MVVRSRTKVRKQVIDCGEQPEGRRARRRGRRQYRRRLRGGQGHPDHEHARRQHPRSRRAGDRLHLRPGPADRAGHGVDAWGLWEKSKFEGIEVAGKVLGIIGMGRIGQALAQRAAALGMLVLGYDSRTVGAAPYMHMVELDELLEKADFISLHIPLTESSKHMLNAEMIGKMKTGVRIVDCARGGVIDEDALYEAIVAGKVAGAALDVFENEPLTDRKLFELPQVIGSPHVGAATKEATARIGDEVAGHLDRRQPGRLPVKRGAVDMKGHPARTGNSD